MTANLKPCPLCGELAEMKQSDSLFLDTYRFSAECAHCKARTDDYKKEGYAIEAWNNRPFEDHAVEVLAEKLHHITQLERIHSNYVYWKDLSEATRNEYRAEAKQLLGVR